MLKRLIPLLAFAASGSLAEAQAVKPAVPPPRPQQAEAQPIPRALFLSNMDTEFKNLDTNPDGVLTKKEIEDHQTSEIILRAQARKRALFAGLDTDHNGVIDQNEFQRLPSNEAAPNAQPMLQRFDTNRDGRISLIEYRAGTLSNFDHLDADKDGIVTPAEMRAGGIAPK